MVMNRCSRRSTVLAVLVFGSWFAAPVVAEVVGSAWDGVYTKEQAEWGGQIYPSVCGRCHGYRLDGAPDDPDMFSTPPIAGPKFLRDWNGNSLAALFEYTRATMPENNPGFLSDQEFIAIITYMLAVSEMPPGPSALPVDIPALAGIAITLNP
jgi:cytochrome c5